MNIKGVQTAQALVDWKVSPVMKIKGKYGFRITLIFDGSQKVQQRSGFDKEKDANRERDRVVAELYNQTYSVEEKITVEKFFRSWLNDVMKSKIKAHTFYSYRNCIENYIVPLMGGLKLSEVNKGHILDFYKRASKKSRSTTRVGRVVLKSGFDYAVTKNFVPANPCIGTVMPSDPNKVNRDEYHTIHIDSKETLNAEEISILLEAAKKEKIYLHVLFAALMGLRRSEIVGLKYSDIDYVRQTIHVQRQLGKDLNVDSEKIAPKTITKQEIKLKTFSSDRVLEMPNIVFNAVLEAREQYERNKSRRKKEFQDMDYICCSAYGRAQSPGYCHEHYKKLLKDTGLPNIRFHDLRHSFATLLMKEDFNPKAVSKLLGHSRSIISVDVYGDTKEIIADCADEIESYVEEVYPDDNQLKTDDPNEFLDDVAGELLEK